ncbi:hypothetical protein Gotri_002682 [Gossypium trilobum]|uniref:DUF4283 domain-containing protein n=1 Tax=Gossypium trilobum TaxID=34281 RepID=A0A7J9FB47_9ROSI|nr:hypothetical protein [Gossypium trilobum]
MDLDRVVNGALWIFNNHILVFRKLHVGEDPVKVPLRFSTFSVQEHDLPMGLF